jgi:hypothetical protein
VECAEVLSAVEATCCCISAWLFEAAKDDRVEVAAATDDSDRLATSEK